MLRSSSTYVCRGWDMDILIPYLHILSGTCCFFILLIMMETQALWSQNETRRTVQLPIARASSLRQINYMEELHELILRVFLVCYIAHSPAYVCVCRWWEIAYLHVYMHDMHIFSVRATWATFNTCLSGVICIWWRFRTQFCTWWAKRATWGISCVALMHVLPRMRCGNFILILCVV